MDNNTIKIVTKAHSRWSNFVAKLVRHYLYTVMFFGPTFEFESMKGVFASGHIWKCAERI